MSTELPAMARKYTHAKTKGPPAPKSLFVPPPTKKVAPVKYKRVDAIGKSGADVNINIRVDKIKSAMKTTVNVIPLSHPNVKNHNEMQDKKLSDFELELREKARLNKLHQHETDSVMSWDTATMVKVTVEEPKCKMQTAFDIHSLRAAALANQRREMKSKIVDEVFREAIPDAATYDVGAELIPVQQDDSKLRRWAKFLGIVSLSLHESVFSGSIKHLEKALLNIWKKEEEQGGAFKRRGMSSAVDFIDDHGQTALSLACKVNRLDMAERILDADADPDIIDSENGMSPLMYAIMAGNLNMVNALLSKGACVNLCNFECVTPMMLACGSKSNNIEVVKTLYTNSRTDVDIDAQDDKGWTALHHCVFSDSPLCAEYLVRECFARRDIRDLQKKKPLHLAIFMKRGECEVILEERRDRLDKMTEEFI